jgi:carbamoyl-phosphate synthase large subunit
MNRQTKRIFVSGAAGVIGSEMIPRLVRRGYAVWAADLKPQPAIFPSGVQYRQGDLNEMTAAELAAFAPDTFIHLAATFERSTETHGFWEENFLHNLRLSHHLMSLASGMETLRRVVFASSYLIYDQSLYQFDRPQAVPVSLRETDPIHPRNLTGMAKLAHEMELRHLDSFCRFSTVCARIFRGYGRNSRCVISRWIRAAQKGEPIKVYRPEGCFDYIYAADTAEGLIRLAENQQVTGIVNLGTGRARRVQEVVDVLKQHFPALKTVAAETDIPCEASQADTTRWAEAIGWTPEYTLETAIAEMIGAAVLVTSASKKVPLIRAVKQAAEKLHPGTRVIPGDCDPAAAARYVADDFWVMPPVQDDELPALLAGCRQRNVRTVIPTRDGELAFWARHRAAFAEAGIHVIVSAPAAVELCLDKLAFSKYGIPAALSPDELDADRFVVKERYGAGSRGIGLNLDRQAALAHAARLEHPIFQPFINGTEISVDAWVDRCCRVHGLVLRRRETVINGESQVTATFRDAAVEKRASDLLAALGVAGPVVLQAIVDEAGKPHFIECNPRFGGASTTGIAAGLDSFYWSMLEAEGGDVSACSFRRIPGEVRQVRVPADIHLWF